jgi:hypothetical protein
MAIYLALIKKNDIYFLSRTGVLRDVGNEEWICGEQLNPFAEDDSPQAPPYGVAKENECDKGVELKRMKNYLRSIVSH